MKLICNVNKNVKQKIVKILIHLEIKNILNNLGGKRNNGYLKTFKSTLSENYIKI